MENSKVKEKKAAKKYICDACGCNINKGEKYLTERVWFKGRADEGDYYLGYMKTMHYHLSNSECTIAVKLVQDYFFNKQTA